MSEPFRLIGQSSTTPQAIDCIICLSFSPHAIYLAAGNAKGEIIIWTVSPFEEIHRFVANKHDIDKAVETIKWHPRHRSLFFYGCRNGAVLMYDFKTKEDPTPVLHGTQGTVHAVDYCRRTSRLAIAVDEEVHITQHIQSGHQSTMVILPPPGPSRKTTYDDIAIQARGLHFLRNGHSIIVSYLDHGVICWDILTSTRLWTIEPTHPGRSIGGSALSSDERYILVTNLRDGMTLYPLNVAQSRPLRSFRYAFQPSRRPILSAAFLYKDKAVTCSSPQGTVAVWNVKTEEVMQVLDHPGRSANCLTTIRARGGELIATAGCSEGEEWTVSLWKSDLGSSAVTGSMMWWIRFLPEHYSVFILDLFDTCAESVSESMGARSIIRSGSIVIYILVVFVSYALLHLATPNPLRAVGEVVSKITSHGAHLATYVDDIWSKWIDLVCFLIHTVNISMQGAVLTAWGNLKGWIRESLKEFLRDDA